MLYGPDCLSTDEDGLSDDNDYYDFKQKVKASRRQAQEENSEVDQKKQHLKSIFSAITYGQEQVVFEELDKGLDVDIDLDAGWTPLLLAATTANVNIMSVLIEKGANVNQSRDGATPLMLLCNNVSTDEPTENNILACAQLLLDKNVEINAKDNKRKTAIMSAANNGHLEVVKLLLPLVEKEDEDNQRWNVLFWAVDGNHPKIVKFLLDEEFKYEKTDIRGNTPADLAHHNGFQEVLDLFPKDPCEQLCIHMNNNELNFEETFNSLGKNEKPRFFNDVCNMLYGTKSEQVMPLLDNNGIGLYEFLSFNESKLREIGVRFPYQRNRILGGLYRFHKHPFKPQSIPFVKKDELYTNLDVSVAILTCIKQLIAMEAALKFILGNTQEKLSLRDSKEVHILIAKTRQQVLRLRGVSEQLMKKTEKWDLMLKPVDRITIKRKNIPWCNLWLAVGVLSAVLIYKFK